jgi:hypothetical protein
MYSRELPKLYIDPLQRRVAGQFAARVSKKARLTLGRRLQPIGSDEAESLDRGLAIVDSFTTISASEISSK